MIIWINGAFGSGKTHTAYELHRRFPNSFVYDPENMGFFIRDNIPKNMQKNDFQDYPIWRELNFTFLKYIADHYNGIIIVPMTIVHPTYYQEIVVKLKNENITVKHFVLWASKKTLENRLCKRGDGNNSWPAKQIDRCMQSLSNNMFQQRIVTDDVTIEQVAEKIASMCGIHLLPDHSK
ncbi:AAA family ATPase [Virgibacillus sp.]|nr:AAA family ATPase [Virgibacillus sp.]NWO14934.1 AAA family ATPase [Virgibacillus sp.]